MHEVPDPLYTRGRSSTVPVCTSKLSCRLEPSSMVHWAWPHTMQLYSEHAWPAGLGASTGCTGLPGSWAVWLQASCTPRSSLQRLELSTAVSIQTSPS